jgi:hypothetical protein
MNIPGFDAEKSLYKTAQLYRGCFSGVSGINTRASLVPQLSCSDECLGIFAACNLACLVSGGAFVPFCLAGCYLRFDDCSSGCSSGGGGVGGTPHPCCPRGTRCCGGCTKVPGQGLFCEGECIGPNEECTT